MLWLLIKYAITAGMVVFISEVAKRSDRLGGLVAALPLVTVLVLVWMKLEGQSQQKISQSCVVYILVCSADTTYVFTIPCFLSAIWLLDHAG